MVQQAEIMKTAQERRSESLKWWALLKHYERDLLAEEHTGRRYHTLTGREVEEIYKLYGDETG